MAELRPIQFGDPYKGVQDILKLLIEEQRRNELTAYQKEMLKRSDVDDARRLGQDKLKERSPIIRDVDAYFSNIMYDDRFYNEKGYNPDIAFEEASQFFSPIINENPQLKSHILRRIKINSKGLPKLFTVQKSQLKGLATNVKQSIKDYMNNIPFDKKYYQDGEYNADLIIDDLNKDANFSSIMSEVPPQYKNNVKRYISNYTKSLPQDVWIQDLDTKRKFLESQIGSIQRDINAQNASLEQLRDSGLQGGNEYLAISGDIFNKTMQLGTLENSLNDVSNNFNIISNIKLNKDIKPISITKSKTKDTTKKNTEDDDSSGFIDKLKKHRDEKLEQSGDTKNLAEFGIFKDFYNMINSENFGVQDSFNVKPFNLNAKSSYALTNNKYLTPNNTKDENLLEAMATEDIVDMIVQLQKSRNKFPSNQGLPLERYDEIQDSIKMFIDEYNAR